MTALTHRIAFDGYSGRLVRALRRRRQADCPTILAYHRVSDEPSPLCGSPGLTHSTADFERQMTYLATHYRPVRLRDLVAAMNAGRTPTRTVVVTLDDGFADSLRVAGPILRRLQVPATICVCTSVVGNRDLLWRHKLAWLLDGPHRERTTTLLEKFYRAAGITPNAGESVWDLTRRCFIARVLPPLLEDMLHEVGTSGPELAAAHRPYLGPDDLAKADRDWIDFANHTDTHPVLSALTAAEQRHELETARHRLTDWCGRPPIAVAYPFGLRDSFTDLTASLVEQTGHAAALDLCRRTNRPGTSTLNLSRKPAPVNDESAFERIVEDWPTNADETMES